MRSELKSAFFFVATLVTLSALEQSMLAADNAKSSADLWYLLVRREGKNYYELSRTALLLGSQLNDEVFSRYKPSSKQMGFDLRTDSTIRYGVYQAWKVRVVGTTDSVCEFRKF